MTVVIFVYSDPELQKETDCQPFSTENMFRNYCQPLAKELGLEWIPHLQFGIVLEPGHLTEVIQEIHLIRARFQEMWGAGVDDYTTRRIDPIIKTLEKALKNNHYVWVG